MDELKNKPPEYWQEKLTPEQFYVTRQRGTERPFSGEYDNFYENGVYRCIGCGQPLFSSETKFKTGSGWPSFWEAVDPEAVELRPDHSHGMVRTEVRCSRCGAHLGHVFPDGPQPTGDRFCINSVALDFDAGESAGE